MEELDITKEFQARIELPENITPADNQSFQHCLNWQYRFPSIRLHYFTIVYPAGYCTDLFLNPIENIAPWKDFYKKFKRTFFLGQLQKFLKRGRLKYVHSGSYYYCLNEYSDNYFHWFTEVLPKMLYVKKNNGPDTTFYIPFQLKDYQLASIELCEIKTYKAQESVLLFRKLQIVENFTIYPGIYNPGLLSETVFLLKRSIIQRIKNENRKIYVTRKSANRRKVLNEDKVMELVLKYGFEVYDFDKITFIKQMELMTNTRVLASIHGAGLTNMMFMPKQSLVIEFLPIELTNAKCYFILSGALGHRYHYVNCKVDGTSHITGDYLIDLPAFEKVLAEVLL